MTSRHRRKTGSLGSLPKATAEMGAIMTAAPFVITSRMIGFWFAAAAPTAKDRDEASRMVTEKMVAAQESMLAMQKASVAAGWEMAMAASRGAMATIPSLADDVMSAGLEPYGKRVRSNRKRLAKR